MRVCPIIIHIFAGHWRNKKIYFRPSHTIEVSEVALTPVPKVTGAACDVARGRCRPACNRAGGRGGRGNSLDSSHPHPTHFFCPVPANRPKELNKLHPSRIFSPSVNYHKQMLDGLTIWFGSTFWTAEVRFGGSRVASGIGHTANDGHSRDKTQRRI